MKEIITEIKKALSGITESDKFNISLVNCITDSGFVYKTDYPIALVNAKSRIKNSSDAMLFESKKLFDDSGLTPEHPSSSLLNTIASIGTAYLQSVSIMCLEKEPEKPLLFQVKRTNDYWKKIQDVSHMSAMIETSLFSDDIDVCDVEFTLREIIRKRKEVHALKDVGFVWIAATTSDVSKVIQHYFHDNYTLVKTEEQTFHIAWSSTLRAISMRSFVCPPK